MSLELLKMLPAKSLSFETTHGGVPELTPSMIAAALGMGRLSDKASLYCRIKYQLQTELRNKLESKILVQDVLTWAVKENWICGTGLIPKLGMVALDEMLNESLCRKCNGTGEVKIDDKVNECNRCSGAGHQRFSKAEVARRLGIHRQHYSRTWADRYGRVLGVYVDCEYEIVDALKRLG